MRQLNWRSIGIAVVCAVSLCTALAAPAGAAQYPQDPAARTFTGGAGGWTSSSSFDGSCTPPLLCARVNNEYVAAGDADGNGYITSDYLGVAGVGAVAGTTTGIWESPTFTYAPSGNDPEALAFSLSRRADVDQMLAVAGNSADYSVELRDVSEGNRAITLIAPTSLAGARSWVEVPPVSIKPGRLEPGNDYRIRIESRYKTGTSVVVTGSADYDNVVLGTAGSANGNGNGSRNGGDRNSLRSSELLSLFRNGLSNTAIVTGRGKRLLVKVRCPKTIGRACRITAQGLLRRGRPATTKRTVKVGKGRGRLVVMRVKPKLRAKVAKRKRLLVSEKVRAGSTTATAYKVRRLIRR